MTKTLILAGDLSQYATVMKSLEGFTLRQVHSVDSMRKFLSVSPSSGVLMAAAKVQSTHLEAAQQIGSQCRWVFLGQNESGLVGTRGKLLILEGQAQPDWGLRARRFLGEGFTESRCWKRQLFRGGVRVKNSDFSPCVQPFRWIGNFLDFTGQGARLTFETGPQCRVGDFVEVGYRAADGVHGFQGQIRWLRPFGQRWEAGIRWVAAL